MCKINVNIVNVARDDVKHSFSKICKRERERKMIDVTIRIKQQMMV